MTAAAAAAAVALGGALGALARYGAALALHALGRSAWPHSALAGYPLATLLVNVLGAFLLGLLTFQTRLPLPAPLQLGLTTGFLGALTTFSTFELDIHLLATQRGAGSALSYLLLNLLLGYGAVLAGRQLAS